MCNCLTKRGEKWMRFAEKVLLHIETYTVPQYGDESEDIASGYTVQHCMQAVKKYLARTGRNAREGQELLDLMKMAHYVQMAYDLTVQDLVEDMENEIAEGRSIE